MASGRGTFGRVCLHALWKRNIISGKWASLGQSPPCGSVDMSQPLMQAEEWGGEAPGVSAWLVLAPHWLPAG